MSSFNCFVVGLTGGIGSGKSTASQYFEQLGIQIVNADQVARDCVMPGTSALNEIINHFGKKIIDKNGDLNRSELRKIIFDNESAKMWLEQLLHPIIRDELILRINKASSVYVILESPLLFETKQDNLTDTTLVIDSPIELQIKRASKRDQTSEEAIKKIINSQMKREERIKMATFVIENKNNVNDLKKHVKLLHEKFTKLATKK